MRDFFNLDSPVMRGLSRMADLMIINIIFLITCIPIITIGASCTALHYVMIKMIRNEETYIVKMYFKSFKDNFIQATVEWLLMFVAILIFIADYYVFYNSEQPISVAIIGGVSFVALAFTMTAMYVFPLQARFVNKIKATFKNSFLIMVLNFPKSVLMLILYVLPPVLLFIVGYYAVPFWFLFGVSAPAFGAAHLYKKVFARFEPEEETVTSDLDFTVAVDDEAITDAEDIVAEDSDTE